MRIEDIIRRPLITEKATLQRELAETYVFEVAINANKIEIKKAVEAQFGVKVADVRSARMHGKMRRQGRYFGFRPDWKKVYVRLADGEKPIEFFEGA
ncbi:MAG: 50S ribosomal protein L23 [Acidobacteriota bacterium]